MGQFNAQEKQAVQSSRGRVRRRLRGADERLAQVIAMLGRVDRSPAEKALVGRKDPNFRFKDRVTMKLYHMNKSGAAALESTQRAKNPDVLERMAQRLTQNGNHSQAVKLREEALSRDLSAHRYLALAESLLATGPERLRYDPLLGLSLGTAPQVELAVECLERARTLQPESSLILNKLGLLLVDHENEEKGLAYLERAVELSPQAEWMVTLGDRYRRPHIADFEKALAAYERALQIDISSSKAMAGIINAGVRATMDWERLWGSAERFEEARLQRKAFVSLRLLVPQLRPLFNNAPPSDAVESALETLESLRQEGVDLHVHTIELITVRIQFLGRFSEGFSLRNAAAKRTIDQRGASLKKSPGYMRRLLQAVAYTGQYNSAVKLIDPRPWPSEDPAAQQGLAKLAADAHLLTGNLQPYLDYCREMAEKLPLAADDSMRQMITGQRVAVVGPADTGDDLGEVIDGYDVVIRPNFRPQHAELYGTKQGTRTDITYYTGRDILEVIEEIEEMVEAGSLKLAVARPMSFGVLRGQEKPWLRFYRHDFSLCYHGAPLGIARMIYDLLQFEPGEITIFNSDFYTSANLFTPGYREYSAFGPGSFMNDLVIVHDLHFDFKLIQAFMSTGRVNARGKAGEVLALTPEQYLHKLENEGALR